MGAPARQNLRIPFAESVLSFFRELPGLNADEKVEWRLSKAAVASSATRVFERKGLGAVNNDRNNHLVEARSVICYSSKDVGTNVHSLTVEKSKLYSWKKSGLKLDSNHRQANNALWQIIRCLRSKRSHTARFIKDQDGSLLSNEMNVLGRWREYFQDLSTLVTITLPDAQEIHFRKESTLNAAEILLGV